MSLKTSKNTQTNQQVVHHITLKPHHKKILIGGSTLIVVLLISLSIFTYMIFAKQEVERKVLEKKIADLQEETQSNINSLSESVIQTRESVNNIGSQLGVIDQEFDILRASAGEDFSGIIEASVPSVVTVRTDVGQGTGFIIERSGYIVTNAHVLSDGQGNLASGVHAVTYDQGTKDAEFIGYDGVLDIALLKISGNYNALKLGDSDNIQVGERVIAIGNPLGLQFSVSQGIVSAVHREGPSGIKAYIQTDTALNRGNSGGPLINKNGEVIGINNFKLGDSENIGFALESDYIKDVVNDIYEQEFGENLI